MPEPMPNQQPNPAAKEGSILGLSTNELAGLSVEELTGNKTAITMVMHYYKQLVDENLALKNDVNFYKTYVDGYSQKKTNAALGAVLLAVSNVGIGFGVNLLTSGVVWPGIATLVPGISIAAVGLYFSFKS